MAQDVACHLVASLRTSMVETLVMAILGCMAHPHSADDAPSTVGIIAHPCTVTPKVAHLETVMLKMRGLRMDLLLPGDDPGVLEVVGAASGEADGDHEGVVQALGKGSNLKGNQELVTVAIKQRILSPANRKIAVQLLLLSHRQK